MSDMLRSTFDDLVRDVPMPSDPADTALRIAGRRRRNHLIAAPLGAITCVAVVALVVSVVSVVSSSRPNSQSAATIPPTPVGAGSVPSIVPTPPSHPLSVMTHPIARASMLVRADGDSVLLVSADSAAVRSLGISSSHGYRPQVFALSPDGTRLAFGWSHATPPASGESGTELRILTLATGSITRLALPGTGMGELVEQILWSGDGDELLVKALQLEHADTHGSSDGYGGQSVGFTVDARTATMGASVQPTNTDEWDWSADGKQLLALSPGTADVYDLNGNVLTSIDTWLTAVIRRLPMAILGAKPGHPTGEQRCS